MTAPEILPAQPFIFDYQNGKFGYNTDPERGSDTFSSFSQIDNMQNVKIKYNNKIVNMWYNFDVEETCNICVKLKLKENVHYGDKINLNMWVQHGIVAQSFKYEIPVTNTNNFEYRTKFYGDILTIEFFFPNFAIYYLMRDEGKNDISLSSFKLIDCSSDSEIVAISILYGDSTKDITWYGVPQIDVYGGDFKFYIKYGQDDDNILVSLDSNQICHKGLSTSSTGSNLVWVDGQFLRKSSSSKRYKNSITKISNEKSELNPSRLYDIDIVSFRYNDDYLPQTDQRYNVDIPGFIAEDVYEKYPIACNLDNEGRPEMWDVNIMFPAALKLIQDQHKDIEKLKQEVASLKATNSHS